MGRGSGAGVDRERGVDGATAPGVAPGARGVRLRWGAHQAALGGRVVERVEQGRGGGGVRR